MLKLLALIPFYFSISATASAHFDKVFIVLLENTSYSKALEQPFLQELARKGATLKNYSAVLHPSYPNYLALTSGSTQGKVSDKLSVIQAKHVGDLLEAKGKSWKNYAEDYPGGCFLGNHGLFVARHVPFLSYADVRADMKYCDSHVVDSSQLSIDIQRGTLPDYSFYSPNKDNDGHDTHAAFASNWLRQTFGPRLVDPKFMSGMLFVVTFDEDDDASVKNQVLTILYGDSVIQGSSSDTFYTHYSLLRTIEEALDLGTLGLNDKVSPPITGVWN